MKKKTDQADNSGKELIAALNQIEKEESISKEIVLKAIEDSLYAACKNQFGNADNVKVSINRESGQIDVYAEKTVVDEVEDPVSQMTVEEARLTHPKALTGDVVNVIITPKNFGRIAAQKAKQVVVQKILEEERKVLYSTYSDLVHQIVTGIVQRTTGGVVSVNLGKADAVLTEQEQVKSEHFKPTERIKLYIVDVKDTTKGPRITVSRSHPELIRKLFEAEVAEIQDGTVEIKSIAREAGSRTKIAVYSNDPDVDPVGSCVGVNRSRVGAVINELRGEKIDIVVWSEDPRELIMNALSPARCISVDADEVEKTATVIVADSQLSLAIGKEGQNARLAARLTGYKIDIKSESQVLEEQD